MILKCKYWPQDLEGARSTTHDYNTDDNGEEEDRKRERLLNIGQGTNSRDDETTEWFPVEMDGSRSTAKSVDDQVHRHNFLGSIAVAKLSGT